MLSQTDWADALTPLIAGWAIGIATAVIILGIVSLLCT